MRTTRTKATVHVSAGPDAPTPPAHMSPSPDAPTPRASSDKLDRVYAFGSCPQLDIGNRTGSIHTKQLVAPGTTGSSASPRERFRDVFGPLGVPMVLCFFFAAVVSFSFAAMQLFPLDAMNLLMGTSDLDNGHFWIAAEPPTHITILAAIVLALFGVGYIWLILFMVFFRPLAKTSSGSASDAVADGVVGSFPRTPSEMLLAMKQAHKTKSVILNRIAAVDRATQRYVNGYIAIGQRKHSRWRYILQWLDRTKRKEFTSFTGVYHHYYIVFFDIPKLLLHALNLRDFLAQGFPVPTVLFYATLLGANGLIALLRFQPRAIDRKCVATRMSLLFDLFFAVFAPYAVLLYAYFNFHLDRALFQIREETLTPGAFGRMARLFADPIEIAVFRLGFQNLQLLTLGRIFTKCFLNVLGLTKWHQIIRHLVRIHDEDRQRTASEIATLPNRYHSRTHTWIAVVVVISAMTATGIGVSRSIASSIANCAPYSQCGLVSYRWRWTHDDLCPCLAFIDRDDLKAKTYSEWVDPPDTSRALAQLAKSGLLNTVQIINRKLVELPIELLENKNLRYLILIYTKTKRIPDWAKQFTSLQYLHIEVNVVDSDLEYLPPDLFEYMSNMRLLRIGRGARLTELPSLAGLNKLVTFIVTSMYNLRALPSFDDLTELSTLFLLDMTHVPTLPSLRNVKKLKAFSLSRRNEMCCNGFITGKCDLTDFQCKPRVGEPAVKCIADQIPAADLARISSAKGVVCAKNLTIDLAEVDVTVASSDIACGGVLYKECYNGERRGMCYNSRMQVIACDFFGDVEAMRRLEIARGVGDKCDPEVEAWLGCPST